MTWRRSGDKHYICHVCVTRMTDAPTRILLLCCVRRIFSVWWNIYGYSQWFVNHWWPGAWSGPSQYFRQFRFISSHRKHFEIETVIYKGIVFFRANMHLVGDEDTILVWAEMKLQKQCNRQLKFRLDMLPGKYALRVDYIGSPWKVHMHDTF